MTDAKPHEEVSDLRRPDGFSQPLDSRRNINRVENANT